MVRLGPPAAGLPVVVGERRHLRPRTPHRVAVAQQSKGEVAGQLQTEASQQKVGTDASSCHRYEEPAQQERHRECISGPDEPVAKTLPERPRVEPRQSGSDDAKGPVRQVVDAEADEQHIRTDASRAQKDRDRPTHKSEECRVICVGE